MSDSSWRVTVRDTILIIVDVSSSPSARTALRFPTALRPVA